MRSLLLFLLLCSSSFAQVTVSNDLSDIPKGGLITLPPGVYHTGGNFWPPPNRKLVLRGAGCALTKIIVDNESKNFITIEGPGNVEWEFSNFTVVGGGFVLKKTASGIMRDVIIQDCKTCIEATEAWDCHFDNIRFIRSVNGLVMNAATDLKNVSGTNVNNFCFVNCRFENNSGVGTIMRKGATKNRFLGCKWHGMLPVPAPVDHIVMFGCYDNIFEGCQTTNSGKSAVVMREDCVDNSFSGCHIGNSKNGWGIDGASKNNIEGVVFSTTGGKNKLGNWR